MIGNYLNNIINLLKDIEASQRSVIEKAAVLASKTIKSNGIIHIFGCGHSHLIALDSFYRAGGLANVSPILDTDLMLHNGAAKSSEFEKLEGIAKHIYRRYSISKNDMLIVISSSGKNAVPVDMALEGKKHGVPVVAVTSSAYFNDNPRHSGGKLLYQAADFYIDNLVPHGDASIELLHDISMAPLSTFGSGFIINSILLRASEICIEDGCTPPVYKSGNIDGGAEYNTKLLEEYLGRIKHL